MKLDPLLNTTHMGHILLKTHLHLKLKLLKIIDEDIGISPPDLELGKSFLDIIQKAAYQTPLILIKFNFIYACFLYYI